MLPSRLLLSAPADGMALRLQRLVRLALGGGAAAAAAAAASAAAPATPQALPPQPLLAAPSPPPPQQQRRVNYAHHAAGAAAAVVSRVTYPANDPIEDRFDFRDAPPPPQARGGASSPSSYSGASPASPLAAEAEALLMPRMLACVLDGHGGWQAAEHARRELLDAVERELDLSGGIAPPPAAAAAAPKAVSGEAASVGAALTRAFARVDRSFLASVRPAFELGFGEVAHVGCCAIAAAVLPAAVVVANAGDCRAVLGRVHYPPADAEGHGAEPQLPPELEALPGPVFAPLPDDGGVRDSGPPAAAVWRVGTIPGSGGGGGGGGLGGLSGLGGAGGQLGFAPYLFSATALSRDHNAREPREKARLAALHPGEQDIVVCKVGNPSACYVKGRLQPTRSLGDAYLKESEFNVPPGLGRIWGRHIKAPYTPPYVSG